MGVRGSTCMSCGTFVEKDGEYHPYEVCVLRKAGVAEDQIAAFVRTAYAYLNEDGTWRLVGEGPRKDVRSTLSLLSCLDDIATGRPLDLSRIRDLQSPWRETVLAVQHKVDGKPQLPIAAAWTNEELQEEMAAWLEDHEQTPPVNCLLCEEPVAKDTVVDHLVQKHEHFQVALLVALWWFLQGEDR